MVVTRAAQHHHLTVALMVSDEWAVNDARPVDNPQRCILPAVDSTPPRCPEWAKERAIRPQRSLLLAGPLLRTEDRMTLEGREGTCRSSNAVAGAVSKSVCHPWSPRLTRRGKRLLHYQPYPILKEGGMSRFGVNIVSWFSIGRRLPPTHPFVYKGREESAARLHPRPVLTSRR